MHNRSAAIFAYALILLALAACDRAPKGIIPESKMDDLIVDLCKAEAYMELNPAEFSSDSSKMILKQSVFRQHGINQKVYDRSIEWYANNMDSYRKVYDKAIRTLDSERKSLNKKSKEDDAKVSLAGVRRTAKGYYPSTGDSADVWIYDRTFTLTSNYRRGYITFEMSPDAESKNGDRYKLSLKKLGFGSRFSILLAAEYRDGCSSLVARNSSFDGWDEFSLQCDSTREARRIYGYIRYDVRPFSVAFIDSVSLLRTHCAPAQYSSFNLQKFIPNKQNAK